MPSQAKQTQEGVELNRAPTKLREVAEMLCSPRGHHITYVGVTCHLMADLITSYFIDDSSHVNSFVLAIDFIVPR